MDLSRSDALGRELKWKSIEQQGGDEIRKRQYRKGAGRNGYEPRGRATS